ncbi:divalent metal cation transporter [uncultured Caulobacter sp.]|uniref:divalent metal cation transporter n=1 Tax=uncultured Caulobacter sp. TaxID=158749 RepID=UPI002625A52D|nr:divalent metal cation transporter [uncultured Caulobacter sp.]
MVLTYPLMSAIQLVSARIGRVTGKGLAANLGEVLRCWLVNLLVVLLLAANTINIGANLAAMGAAAELLVHRGSHLFTLAFAILSLLLQLFVPYRRYVAFLKWLTFVLLTYVAVLFTVKLDWIAVAKGLLWPRIEPTPALITAIVAIFGTTISPYLFFWQAAQEVEEVNRKAPSTADAGAEAGRQGHAAYPLRHRCRQIASHHRPGGQ